MKKIYVIIFAGGAILLLGAGGFLALSHLSRVRSPENRPQALYKSADALMAAGRLDEAAFEFQKLTVQFSDSKKVPAALISLAGIRHKQGKPLEAKEACEKVIAEHSSSYFVRDAQKRLGGLNVEILFSPILTKHAILYEVKQGDSLTAISKRFNTTIELLKRSNNLKSDVLRPKMQLKVHAGKFSVVVDKLQNILILKSDEEVFKIYNVSTGKETSVTPAGTFKIINKLASPVWYTAGETIPYGDPRNILGTRWMGFDKPGYGIHGTAEPQSIGRSVTAGCVRMYNREVEELFDILPAGTEVTIVE